MCGGPSIEGRPLSTFGQGAGRASTLCRPRKTRRQVVVAVRIGVLRSGFRLVSEPAWEKDLSAVRDMVPEVRPRLGVSAPSRARARGAEPTGTDRGTPSSGGYPGPTTSVGVYRPLATARRGGFGLSGETEAPNPTAARAHPLAERSALWTGSRGFRARAAGGGADEHSPAPPRRRHEHRSGT